MREAVREMWRSAHVWIPLVLVVSLPERFWTVAFVDLVLYVGALGWRNRHQLARLRFLAGKGGQIGAVRYVAWIAVLAIVTAASIPLALQLPDALDAWVQGGTFTPLR